MSYGYVYFGGYGNAVKIGKSNTPKKRITNLNTANPDNVKLYAAVATFNMDGLEKQMHDHFKYCRRPGKREWYNLTGELKSVIEYLMNYPTATELELGYALGNYKGQLEGHDELRAEARTMKRTIALADLRQREQWAQGYALRSLNFWQYPIFQFRYNEAMTAMATLPTGEAPIFIRDVAGRLSVISEDEAAA